MVDGQVISIEEVFKAHLELREKFGELNAEGKFYKERSMALEKKFDALDAKIGRFTSWAMGACLSAVGAIVMLFIDIIVRHSDAMKFVGEAVK